MLTKDVFFSRLLEVILEEYPDVRVKEKLPFGVILATTSSPEIQVFFDRPYEHYLREPENLERILRQAVVDLLPSRHTLQASFSRLEPYLLPALRSTAFFAAVQRQAPTLPPEALPLRRPLTQSVGISYVIDVPSESTRTVVNLQDLRTWGLSVEDLHATAVRNLAARGPVQITRSTSEVSGSVFAVEPTDRYAASRILLGITQEIARSVEGDVALGLPSPELFLAVPASSSRGVAWLRSVVLPRKYAASTEPITDRLLVYRQAGGTIDELP